MIPQRAFFYWEGEPMSWLRRQSIETFRFHNPDWTVDLIGPGDIPLKRTGRLGRVLRSDWARYRELHENGGIYFDTDIVFCKPIPDLWLEREIILPLADTTRYQRLVGHVAVLGSAKHHALFKFLDEACEIESRKDILQYQQFGVMLADKYARQLGGLKAMFIEPSEFLPVDYDKTECLWQEWVGGIPPSCIGVHWYGGDWLSIEMEKAADESWALTSQCLVAKAWRAGGSADKETLREQHGV